MTRFATKPAAAAAFALLASSASVAEAKEHSSLEKLHERWTELKKNYNEKALEFRTEYLQDSLAVSEAKAAAGITALDEGDHVTESDRILFVKTAEKDVKEAVKEVKDALKKNQPSKIFLTKGKKGVETLVNLTFENAYKTKDNLAQPDDVAAATKALKEVVKEWQAGKDGVVNDMAYKKKLAELRKVKAARKARMEKAKANFNEKPGTFKTEVNKLRTALVNVRRAVEDQKTAVEKAKQKLAEKQKAEKPATKTAIEKLEKEVENAEKSLLVEMKKENNALKNLKKTIKDQIPTAETFFSPTGKGALKKVANKKSQQEALDALAFAESATEELKKLSDNAANLLSNADADNQYRLNSEEVNDAQRKKHNKQAVQNFVDDFVKELNKVERLSTAALDKQIFAEYDNFLAKVLEHQVKPIEELLKAVAEEDAAPAVVDPPVAPAPAPVPAPQPPAVEEGWSVYTIAGALAVLALLVTAAVLGYTFFCRQPEELDDI